MNLYKVVFQHWGPKDGRSGIETYVIANDDKQMLRLIDKHYNYGGWGDKDSDITEEDADEYYNGKQWLDIILECRGEIDNEYVEISDTYYGLTIWGWEEVKANITQEDTNVLVSLGICEDWRDK